MTTHEVKVTMAPHQPMLDPKTNTVKLSASVDLIVPWDLAKEYEMPGELWVKFMTEQFAEFVALIAVGFDIKTHFSEEVTEKLGLIDIDDIEDVLERILDDLDEEDIPF
jgi:hypothetical protein